MKTLITFIFLVLLSASSPAGLFDHEERNRRIAAESQLHEVSQSKDGWEAAASLLAVTCVILLVLGAAIGAKARREVNGGK